MVTTVKQHAVSLMKSLAESEDPILVYKRLGFESLAEFKKAKDIPWTKLL